MDVPFWPKHDGGGADDLPPILGGDGASTHEPATMTQKERAEYRRKLREREQQRIRPGFYAGREPRDNL